ncbi:MAG: hypothetical protein JW940_03710 [Polyangiaceae bacterium]|nr:hypothetical protein [Polyangiaceae bacterium]
MSYFFVPLANDVRRQSRPHARHDLLRGHARFTVTLRTIEAVHIGSGGRFLRGADIVREGARVVGRPGIPGSSLKGVLRSRLEAISKSCCVFTLRRQRLEGACVSRSFGGYEVEFDGRLRGEPVFGACEPDHCCLACSLFGLTTRQGRVRVQDHVADQGSSFKITSMPQLYAPRPHHLGDFDKDRAHCRLTVTRLFGRKFYRDGAQSDPEGPCHLVEAIPTKTVLRGDIMVLSPVDAELGALLAALGQNPKSALRLGSAKGHGFGQVDVEHVEVELRSGPTRSAATPEQMNDWRKAFVDSPDYWIDGEEALTAAQTAGHVTPL